MERADFLIIGGGVAGLSVGAALAPHGKVAVLEAEDAIGHHSSGRSATFSHYGIGNAVVRGLTMHSRAWLLEADGGALARRHPALFVANEEMRPALTALAEDMACHTGSLEEADEPRMRALFPPLRFGSEAIVAGIADPDGLRLDSDAMLQHYARAIRAGGGRVLNGRRAATIRPQWTVEAEAGESFSAPILINAAGAWADQVAALAGVAPIGLKPLRRTIIIVDPPQGADARGWAFVKTAVDDFYILPEGARLAASPVDEIEDDPRDAQPEDYDIALAAWKVEQYTTLSVVRISHRWAGLRTFAADRTPVAGFDASAPGFFWLAGQGGFGLQTAPAMAEAAAALVTGAAWPKALAESGVAVDHLDPARLR
ncbi:NAD(P)/FAD-dependent oxidoreductase [Sphingosinicella sp.]|uniref:NAD(P)/FAD-dependent oxidoreductase n=1 Tax=Sphingosinicella sp. TaxID=1917971 RepID=UPI004037F55A